MVKILLISHGCLSLEFLKTMNMIVGNTNDIEAIPMEVGVDMVAYKKQIVDYINKDDKPTLVITDLLGGSPFLTAASIYKEINDKEKMQVVVGMNLPMLLEVYNAKEEKDLDACVQLAVSTGKKGTNDLVSLMEGK